MKWLVGVFTVMTKTSISNMVTEQKKEKSEEIRSLIDKNSFR